MAKVFDEKKYSERAVRTKTPEQALSSLMRLCARSEKSSGDAMRLMHRWGVAEIDRAKVLDKLVGSKFIDDNRYAEAYAREKTGLNGWGVYKIRRGLAAKGIDRGIIERTLSGLDREAGKRKLDELLRRKMRNAKAVSTYDLKGKLLRYGLGQGYEYEDVISTVEKLVADND